MTEDKIYIIGISPGSSLTPETRQIIDRAEILFGGERLLDMFTPAAGERVVIRNDLPELTERIKANLGQKRMAVLASGDPGFYGIAKYLIGNLGKHICEIIPNVSSMQLAFARIKESWDDATFVSVHSRSIEDIVKTVRSSKKIGIFTDERNTPAAIARVLEKYGVNGYRVYVCEDLGAESEKITITNLSSLREMQFSRLNILILLNEAAAQAEFPIFGIPDEEFHQRGAKDGLITKLEVRAVSLAKMRLAADSLVWDIGAGSGAVSVEASFIAGNGRIFAIEKNSEDVAIIRKNVCKFGASNVEVIPALAPDGLGDLPDPDIVFIGGSSGRMEAILDIACRRLKPKGRIVINAVTLKNLNAASCGLKTRGFTVEVTLINVSRSKDIANLTRLEALNPVFVVTGWGQNER